jgi:uroporphyrinogen-III synthase
MSRAVGSRVLVLRAADQATDLAVELTNAGLEPVLVPAIAIALDPPGGALDRNARWLHTYRWVVITSTNGARAILKAAVRVFTALETPMWAAIGPATRQMLDAEGIEVDFEPRESTATALAAGLPVQPGDRVLVVRGDLAEEELAAALRARGADVDDVVAYRTREAPESSRPLLRAAVDRPIAAAAFTSGSTVRGLVALGKTESVDVRSIPAVCIGPATADEARAAGFRVLAVSPRSDSAALAATTANALARRPEEPS